MPNTPQFNAGRSLQVQTAALDQVGQVSERLTRDHVQWATRVLAVPDEDSLRYASYFNAFIAAYLGPTAPSPGNSYLDVVLATST